MYERFDKTEAVSKGQFSFLIAFAKQLDAALEYEGVDFLDEALGRLAHALAHLLGDDGGVLSHSGGDDDGSDDDDDSSGGVQDEVEVGASAQPLPRGGSSGHRPARALGGAVPGGNNESGSPLIAVRRVPTVKGGARTAVTAATKKGGKRRGKNNAKKVRR